MRSARRGAGLVALAAVTALVLTACGGGGGGSGAAVGDATGGAAQAGNDINPVDPAQLRQGGDFLWSLASLPPQFNRNQVDGTEADNADIMNAMMPIIFVGDAQGVLNPDPDYLESAEVTGTNPQVVTYRLNPKFTWNNGRAADWTDFEAQWKALNGSNPAFLVSGTTGYTDIASITQGATPQEVVVTYAHNYADWRANFVPFFPRETNTDPTVFNEGWLNQPIAGPGRRALRVRQHRPDRAAAHPRAQPEVVGPHPGARPHHLRRPGLQRPARGVRQRVAQLLGDRPERRVLPARAAGARRRDPYVERAELPAHHVQRGTRLDPRGPGGAEGDHEGDRPADHHAVADRPDRPGRPSARQPPLRRGDGRVPGQLRRRRLQPRRRTAGARRRGLDSAGQRPCEGRQAARRSATSSPPAPR